MENIIAFLKKSICSGRKLQNNPNDFQNDENTAFELRMKKNNSNWKNLLSYSNKSSYLNRSESSNGIKRFLYTTPPVNLKKSRMDLIQLSSERNNMTSSLFSNSQNIFQRKKKINETGEKSLTNPMLSVNSEKNIVTTKHIILENFQSQKVIENNLTMPNTQILNLNNEFPMKKINTSFSSFADNQSAHKEFTTCIENTETNYNQVDRNQFKDEIISLSDNNEEESNKKTSSGLKRFQFSFGEEDKEITEEISPKKPIRFLKVQKFSFSFEDTPKNVTDFENAKETLKCSPENSKEMNEEKIKNDYNKIYSYIISKKDTRNYPIIDFFNYKKYSEKINVNDQIVNSNLQLSCASFQSLKAGRCINDEIVNSYSQLIFKRATTTTDSKAGLPIIHIFSTYFYEKLISLHESFEEIYCQLSKFWEGKHKKINLFNYDLLLIPLNLQNYHWSLVTINMKNHTIVYYDSLKESREKEAFSVMADLSFVFGEYLKRNNNMHTNGVKLPNDEESFPNCSTSSWSMNIASVPLQRNGYDCGIFTCKFMDYISRGEEINFTQDDMPYFRVLMGIEFLNSTLFSY